MTKEIELKGFTQEQIKEMNDKAIGYHIANLPRYPVNRKHFEAILEFGTPFVIFYNAEPSVLRIVENETIKTNMNKWCVLTEDVKYYRYKEEFDSVEDAVQWAYLCHDKEVTRVYEIEHSKMDMILDRRGYRYK